MQIPFQYSLHIQKDKAAKPRHKEFLAKEGEDPRKSLIDRLCRDIPADVCVTVYWKKFEQRCLKELADYIRKDNPDKATHLMSIHDNIVDLIEPFQSGAYYCREMQGSSSLKTVLPALCPDDPELDYSRLAIKDGIEASRTYAELHTKSDEEIAKTRTDLLEYCELDSLAMVKILEKLYECI